MKITSIIKAYCKANGLRPSHIAAAAGIDQGNMSRLMNGKHKNCMNFFRMVSLLKACEVPASEVYNVEPE